MTLSNILRHSRATIIICVTLACLQLLTVKHAAAEAISYSIVLASARGKNLKWQPKTSPLFEGYSFYVEQAVIKNKVWERLCLGYFDTRKQAIALQKKIQTIYPGAWVQKTPPGNIIVKQAERKSTRAAKKKPQKKSSLSDKQLDSLMQRAKSDFKNKNYSSAIRFFTALVEAGEHKHSMEALEMLGLSRQRKGQKRHAADTYESYLELYPDSEGSDRVRQRLAGLLTASRAPQEKIEMTTLEQKDEFTTYGSLSQFYRRNRASSDDIGTLTTLSQLITFIDLTTLQKSASFDHRYQFTTDHTYDFLDEDEKSEFRFIETYYEVSYRKTGSSARLGRQALRIGGLLRRFDGLSAGYQFTPDLRFNILGGLPVETVNKTSFNKYKTFYGAILETGTFLNNWEMNLFYFDQQIDDLTDRRTAGSEIRYRDNTKSMFGMLGYDLFYDAINIAQLNANILFDHGRSAYMNAFFRKSPLLATSNALIGETVNGITTIEQLQQQLNIEQIYQLAKNKTANSSTITVGGSQPISESFQTAADITVSRTDDIDTVDSAGNPLSLPGTGPDYFFSLQLIGNNLMKKYDTVVLGVRYYDTDPSDTTSLILNTRFPITRAWRVNPRLQYDFRKLVDGREQQKLRAILKTDYRYLNKARFDFEIGYDETSENNNDPALAQAFDNNNLFFTLGYRWDF